MKKNVINKIVLLCIATAVSLSGADYKVSLDEAIDIALKNNNKLKASQTSIKIAQTMYNQAMSAHYPTLDVEVSAMRMDEPPTFEMRGTTQVDNTNTIAMYNNLSAAAAADGAGTTSATYAGIAASIPAQSKLPIEMEVQMAGRDTVISKVNAALPLYTGGKISAIVKQAGIAQKIAQEAKRRSTNEVIFDVKRYYYGVVLTKQLEQLSSDTLERMGFIRDLTSELYKGGSMNVKKTDYLRTKLSLNLIESMNERILEKEIMAKSALLFAMGLSHEDSVDVVETTLSAPKMDAMLKSLVENAYSFNPEFKTLKLAVDVYEAKIDEAQSDYLPTVGVMASAQNIYNDYEYGIVNDTNKNSWIIGVGVQWSLFNGMRTTNKVEQSRLEKLRLQQQELLLQEGIALQVKQAFMQIKSTYKQYNILSEAIDTAAQNRDLNARAYQEDMVETKDVIESQLFEAYTKADYYRCIHDHALARASADFIVGEALKDSLK